jgi:hypothetical protein
LAQDRSRRSQFCDASSIPFLPTCIPLSPSLGTYTDFVGLQFLVIGPPPENTSISQSFDSGLMTGIGSFAIDPTASGAVSGLIVVTYDLYSVSPNDPIFDPNDEISGSNFATAQASMTVTSTPSAPEPGSMALLGTGLVAVLLTRKRRY